VGGASGCLYRRKITGPSLVALMWPSHSMITWIYTRCTKSSIFDSFKTPTFMHVGQQREDVARRLGGSCEYVEPSYQGYMVFRPSFRYGERVISQIKATLFGVLNHGYLGNKESCVARI
jgi:hypothetical protein